MKLKIWIAMIAMLSLFNNYAFAWSDTLTHLHISRRAIESSSFDQYFKDRLKLADGKNEILNGRSLAEWLQYGSEMEDDPDCRASNHFHNPYKPWLQAGLTDTVGVINWWCWATTDFPAEDISSNLVWATGYLNRSGTGLDFDSMAHYEWDWQSARDYFLNVFDRFGPIRHSGGIKRSPARRVFDQNTVRNKPVYASVEGCCCATHDSVSYIAKTYQKT